MPVKLRIIYLIHRKEVIKMPLFSTDTLFGLVDLILIFIALLLALFFFVLLLKSTNKPIK